jgi:hypothetical protein
MDTLKIGELAAQADCPVETIRYYEKEALLPEPRAQRRITGFMARGTWSGCSSSATAVRWT